MNIQAFGHKLKTEVDCRADRWSGTLHNRSRSSARPARCQCRETSESAESLAPESFRSWKL